MGNKIDETTTKPPKKSQIINIISVPLLSPPISTFIPAPSTKPELRTVLNQHQKPQLPQTCTPPSLSSPTVTNTQAKKHDQLFSTRQNQNQNPRITNRRRKPSHSPPPLQIRDNPIALRDQQPRYPHPHIPNRQDPNRSQVLSRHDE